MDFPPQDDFKWFGEGFDGFPKRLPEDVVEYIVFIIDTKLSHVQTRERLQAFQKALTALEKRCLKEYIWQRDPISLSLVRENGRWLLKGTSNYGDSVADEWLIVWLLRELSNEFKDAWIRIYDSDGEFLLIEAANALPRWLNPEVAEHRVWLHNSQLRIIPLSPREAEAPRPLSLEEALDILTKTPLKAEHMPKVEEEAFHRLKSYPDAIRENQHHAVLPLPRKIAHLLHINPSYISPAVEAFYLRDPISLRLLQPEKSKVPLVFPPQDFVTVSVRFTRVLYAQLLGQQWAPLGAWNEAFRKLVKGGVKEEKAKVAIKVAAGFEMLVQHSIYADKKSVREMRLLLEDLETGDDILPTDVEIDEWGKREDDEKWLDIDFSEFERELEGKGKSKAAKGDTGGFGDKHAQENLRKMVERFTAFLEDEDAGLDGARDLGLDPMDVDDDSETDASVALDTGTSAAKAELEADTSVRPTTKEQNKDRSNTKKAKNSRSGRSKRPLGWDTPSDSSDSSDAPVVDSDNEDAYADAEYAEYENAFERFMTLSSAEKSALLDDARELANAADAEKEEDEEIQKLAEAMEKELFGYGALDLNPPSEPERRRQRIVETDKGKGKSKAKVRFDDAEEMPKLKISGDAESEGDDDDIEYLDADYNLADNMLKAFKGQAGMAGPAGNLMRMMGVQFPPDADDGDFQVALDSALSASMWGAKGMRGLTGNGEGSSKP